MLKNLIIISAVVALVFVTACSRPPDQQAATSQAPAAEQAKEADAKPAPSSAPQQAAETASRSRPSPTGEARPGGAAAREAQRLAPAPPAREASRTLRLEAGTPVVVRTTVAMSTKTAQPGDAFAATLEKDLSDGAQVVARRGSKVTGRIVTSDPGGRAKGRAKLSVEVVSVVTNDGREIQVATAPLTTEAKSTVKRDATRTGIAAGVGAAIGAIAGGGKGAAIGAGVGGGAGTAATLATRGDPAVIPSETVLRFELAQSVAVTLRE